MNRGGRPCAAGQPGDVAGGGVDHRDGVVTKVGDVDRARCRVDGESQRGRSDLGGWRLVLQPELSAASQVEVLITESVSPYLLATYTVCSAWSTVSAQGLAPTGTVVVVWLQPDLCSALQAAVLITETVLSSPLAA